MSTEWNSVNGVPYEEILSVKWVLEDDVNRLYLSSKTYYPNEKKKMVEYPRSPAEVLEWIQVSGPPLSSITMIALSWLEQRPPSPSLSRLFMPEKENRLAIALKSLRSQFLAGW